MSISMSECRKIFNEIASESLQESWDNCGMQIDMGREYVERILVCLEITKDIVNEAIEENADLIVTHHPLLFHSIKKIDKNTIIGNYLIDLIFTGISVYASHTAFDTADGGNNDDLAKRLGLLNISQMKNEEYTEERAMGRMGYLPQPMSLSKLAEVLDKTLEYCGGIKISGDTETIIQKVGLCTGAAGEFIERAAQCGCDVYITGDVKHHEAQMAKEMGICLIDAGHFGTEHLFRKNMAAQLRDKTNGRVVIIESKIDLNPYNFMI
ncbi:Nif3-like dinuclear metal center hexameric protein [Anaerovorax sp. IOR16]|uniref:Nif3-like dinuclear metal center hexameric protein n=1 Tax=Anaerovorax sp. IOR16 TaxID=2773458 RepID=UPI0019CFF2B0|nr:Nif3-like dinuclear metal center hexameric protein [Anaerovorax sp. IOR16]